MSIIYALYEVDHTDKLVNMVTLIEFDIQLTTYIYGYIEALGLPTMTHTVKQLDHI